MVELTMAVSRNPFLTPFVDGSVPLQGLAFAVSVLHPAEVFHRQLKGAEFDVSEMSMASVVRLLDGGDNTWLPLPVFPYRTFFHTWMLVRPGSGINQPTDLAGAVVGLPEYPITGAVWTRGVLEHEFGVAASDVTWLCERQPGNDLSTALAFEPPADVKVEVADPESNLASLAAEGRVDAIAVPIMERGSLDPSADALRSAVDTGNLRPLFPDSGAEARRYREATGLVHINHTVVVRRALLDGHPGLVPRLIEAFEGAKRQALAAGSRLLSIYGTAPEVQIAGDPASIDPVPYGLDENAAILGALLRYLHEQGITARQWGFEEVFSQ